MTEALERQIRKNPDDPAPYLVLGDQLLAAGNPHGELIAVQNARREREARRDRRAGARSLRACARRRVRTRRRDERDREAHVMVRVDEARCHGVSCELDTIVAKVRAAGVPVALIVDSGKTEFHGVPTKTCCAVGPAWTDDAITGELALL